MRWLDRLDKHFSNWTIPQFPLFIASINGLIYVLAQIQPFFISRLTLFPQAIAAGEWWRVVTFLFVPPMLSPLWILFWLLLLYQYAQALENEWGEFKFLFFYFIGAAATVLAAMAMGEPLSNVPLNTTMFLAFATLYPDFQLLLFFILPIKVKYLALIVWVGLIWSFVWGTAVTRVGIAASLVNYFLFFGPFIWEQLKLKVEVYRNRRRFRT